MAQQTNPKTGSGTESPANPYNRWHQKGAEKPSLVWRLCVTAFALLTLSWVVIDLWPVGPIGPSQALADRAEILTTARQKRVPVEPVRNRMQEMQIMEVGEREQIRRVVAFIEAMVRGRQILQQEGLWISSTDVLVSVGESLQAGAQREDLVRIFQQVSSDNQLWALTQFTRFLQEGENSSRAASRAIGAAGAQGGG